MSIFLKLFCLVCAVGPTKPAKILAVYPTPSISHQVVFRPLMQELAKRGHEVVVITTDPVFPKGKSPQNLTEIDVHDISYEIWDDLLKTGKAQEVMSPTIMKIFQDKILEAFQAQVKSKEIQNLLNDKERSFDLLFTEACVTLALSFAFRFNVPVIEFSSFGGVYGTFENSGAPTNYFLYPTALRRRIYNLTLWEKISAVHYEYMMNKAYDEHIEIGNKVMRDIFGPKIPSLKELKKRVHLTFLNVNPIWDFNRPVPPNIIYLGGVHQKPDKKLPKDLQTYLDSSKRGVIYLSFGTNARPSLLPPEKLKIFRNVFSQLPYDILWKWDKEELPGRSNNVKIFKWLPQSDLLKHPNIKLFITQGGLQSTDEAITAAVPLVVIPFLVDQWFNAEMYVKFNIGIHVDLETITEVKLKSAIETAIKDDSYRENVVRLRKLMSDQPQPPLERAVWWTEYVLRHGGARHLQSPAAHMHWTEYYAVDLVLLLFTVSIALFLAAIFGIRFAMLQKRNLEIKVKRN